MVFARQISFIDELEGLIFAGMKSAVGSFDFVLKDYIVNKQLFREGIDGDGNKLSGYKRTTIRYKLRKGQPVDRKTLLDEGVFHASIMVDEHDDHFEISSDVSYDKYIVKRWSNQTVLKVTDEHMKEFMINYFLPNLKENIHGRFAK